MFGTPNGTRWKVGDSVHKEAKRRKSYTVKYLPVKMLREDNHGFTNTHSHEYDNCINSNRPGYYKISRFLYKKELGNRKAIDIYQVIWYPRMNGYLTDSDAESAPATGELPSAPPPRLHQRGRTRGSVGLSSLTASLDCLLCPL